MRYEFVIAGLFVIVVAYAASQQSGLLLANATLPSNMSAAIDSAAAYVNMVNRSAYVAFYPNMSDAYLYLSDARSNASSGDYANAYALLGLAKSSAAGQLQRINQYKYATLAVLTAFLVALILVLRRVMRPIGGRRQK